MSVRGRIQREGDVVHLVAQHLTDLSAELSGAGERDDSFPLPHGLSDEFRHSSAGIDPRSCAEDAEAAGHFEHRQRQSENVRFPMNWRTR